jgi:hypothetical protein
MQLADAARTQSIYRLAMQAIREAPLRFASTLASTLATQIRTPFAFFFNLGLPLPYELYFLPAILGLFAWRRFPFLPACLLGIFLSSPFLVDGGPRVYAATLFAPAALAAAGMGLVTRHASIEVRVARPLSFALAGLFASILVVAPFAFFLHKNTAQPPAVDGLMQIRVRPGSGIVVGGTAAIGDAHTVTSAALAVSPGLRELRAGAHLHPGSYLTSALDRSRPNADQPMYFVFDRQPPFGDLTIRTTLLEAAPFGHSLYAAEVVPK